MASIRRGIRLKAGLALAGAAGAAHRAATPGPGLARPPGVVMTSRDRTGEDHVADRFRRARDRTGASLPLSGAAFAGPLAVTAADPVAVVTIPDAWPNSRIPRGVEFKTPDDEIYVWFELVAPGEMDAVQKEHDLYFQKEGVKIIGSSETTKQEVDGRAWSFTELKATSKDGASIIRYIAINPNVAGKIILMTYWASDAGHKTYDAQMRKIFESIAFK